MMTRFACYAKIRSWIIFALVALLVSCSIWQDTVRLQSVRIRVDEGVNDNSPVAVDFVAVKGKELVKSIQTFSSESWFDSKKQLLQDYPKALSVWEMELVPGSQFSTQRVPLSGQSADGLFLFVGYRSSGAHRFLLEPARDIHIEIGAEEVRFAR